jgi:hypothetical protein
LNIAQQKEELYRTFAREHYELQMMMKNVTLTYYKQQETLARLAIQIWNDKMEHHKLQQRIVLTAKLIDEATAIVKTLALPLLFTLELYNSFPEAHNITRNRLFSSSEAELFLPLSFGHCDRVFLFFIFIVSLQLSFLSFMSLYKLVAIYCLTATYFTF